MLQFDEEKKKESSHSFKYYDYDVSNPITLKNTRKKRTVEQSRRICVSSSLKNILVYRIYKFLFWVCFLSKKPPILERCHPLERISFCTGGMLFPSSQRNQFSVSCRSAVNILLRIYLFSHSLRALRGWPKNEKKPLFKNSSLLKRLVNICRISFALKLQSSCMNLVLLN